MQAVLQFYHQQLLNGHSGSLCLARTLYALDHYQHVQYSQMVNSWLD